MAQKYSTAEILRAYEKCGSVSGASALLQIEDWEVLQALADAPRAFRLAFAEARIMDTLIMGLHHLRGRFKTMRAPSTSAAVRDLGKLLLEFQGGKRATGGGGSGLGLTATEEKHLEETMTALEDNDNSNANDA